MENKKLEINLFIGGPVYVDFDDSINAILTTCGDHRKISINSRKGFLLVQNEHYFFPDDTPITLLSADPIYYRYIDYHTDKDCLYYIDSQCFEYVYHQYKHDVRHLFKLTNDNGLLSELVALEILILAMIFGEPLKPHKFIKHYRDLTEEPVVDTECKEMKNNIFKILKGMKNLRTEYECMERYLNLVDNNIQRKKFTFNVSLDLSKNRDIKSGVINIYKDKIEILESMNENEHILVHVESSKRKERSSELHSICYSDQKIYIRVFEDNLKVDIRTQHGWYGVCFAKDDQQKSSTDLNSFIALLFFYINLEYPRTRKEPIQAEIISVDGKAVSVKHENCPLVVPVPPIHYKLTRQDVRMILKKYGTQDGWYMFSTFEAPPKKDDSQTNGALTLSYCMFRNISQVTVNFSQDLGFGPPTYRTEDFRGKKFCSLFELASHYSIKGNKLHTFVSRKMVDDVAEPQSVVYPLDCIEKLQICEPGQFTGAFYSHLDDKKHTVRIRNLPLDFRFATQRVQEVETLVRELCDVTSVHEDLVNLVRLFGICRDEKSAIIKLIEEDFGVCLYDHLMGSHHTNYSFLLAISHQIASGLQALHFKQIVHGFPVLHNCFISVASGHVKLGNVGIFRIAIGTHRLDGTTLSTEESPFESFQVSGAPRFHPARWLPKETLFNHNFSEQTDRWCFGTVLWQIFNNTELPLSHLSDVDLVECLKQDKECWFYPRLEVRNKNKILETMLEKTIKYCLDLSCVDSIAKVVKLLDPEVPETEYTSCYTFANLRAENLPENADIEIENIDGRLTFIRQDVNTNSNDLNFKKHQDKNVNLYGVFDTMNIQEGNGTADDCLVSEVFNDELTDVLEYIDEIDPRDITMTDTIGQGNFATVKKGMLKNDKNPDGVEVAIKVYYPDIKVTDIKKEIDAMRNLKHDNIIPLRGIYRGDGWWLVMNFYKFGSLDKYIEQNPDIQVERLSLFGAQIAEGMQYLSNKRYIHRDLSTRNVLVQNHSKVKIADLGLSRSVEKQYYKHKAGMIPYLWYPPEFFDTYTYGRSLDVWSYGVTCHEIFNNVQVPYFNCNPPIKDIDQLIDFFKEDKRLAIPETTPHTFRTIITNCWREKSQRWTFDDIVEYINTNRGVT